MSEFLADLDRMLRDSFEHETKIAFVKKLIA